MEAMDKADKGPVLPVDVDHDFVICEIQNKPACQWPFSRVICFFSLGIRSTVFLCFAYITADTNYIFPYTKCQKCSLPAGVRVSLYFLPASKIRLFKLSSHKRS